MGSLIKIGKTYFAKFKDLDGETRRCTTKQRDPNKAAAILFTMEQRVSQGLSARPDDEEKRNGAIECAHLSCVSEPCLYHPNYGDSNGIFIGTVCREHMVYKGPWDMEETPRLDWLFQCINDREHLYHYRGVLPLPVPKAFEPEILDVFRKILGRDPAEHELDKILTWQP